MNTYIINSIGLFFDIAGAWFIAIEVVYQYKGQKYRGNLTLDPSASPVIEDPKSLHYTKTKNICMWIGLSFLTIGFGLQIYSNLFLHGNVNNVLTINDSKNNDSPAIVTGDDKELPENINIKPTVNTESQNKPLKDQKLLKEEK